MSNKKAKGVRAKTRDKFKRRGKRLSVNKLLREFKAGDRVQVNINSSVHSGMPFKRYQGISGVVTGMQGRSLRVALREGNAYRTLIVNAAHLKSLH